MSRLVLTAKRSESIILEVDGREIEIFLKDARGGQARLAFDIDPEVKVRREKNQNI